MSRGRDRLPLSRESIWVLENMSRLRRRALGLPLGVNRSLLLGRRFVGLSRPLQDGGLLRWLSVNRLTRELGMDLLSRHGWTLCMLVLGSLQDLLRELPREAWHAWHAWILRLSRRHLLRVVRGHRNLSGCHVLLLLQHLRGLLTHHGFDLVQTHHLSCRSRSVLRRFLRLRSGRLLGLQPPDVGTRLQSRDVLGILVALVTRPGRLGGVRNRRLLLLGGWMASLVDHLLLLQRVCNLGCLTGKIEISPDVLLGDWGTVAKGVIVEGIIGFVELVTQSIVRLFEVNSSHKLARTYKIGEM